MVTAQMDIRWYWYRIRGEWCGGGAYCRQDARRMRLLAALIVVEFVVNSLVSARASEKESE